LLEVVIAVQALCLQFFAIVGYWLGYRKGICPVKKSCTSNSQSFFEKPSEWSLE